MHRNIQNLSTQCEWLGEARDAFRSFAIEGVASGIASEIIVTNWGDYLPVGPTPVEEWALGCLGSDGVTTTYGDNLPEYYGPTPIEEGSLGGLGPDSVSTDYGDFLPFGPTPVEEGSLGGLGSDGVSTNYGDYIPVGPTPFHEDIGTVGSDEVTTSYGP